MVLYSITKEYQTLNSNNVIISFKCYLNTIILYKYSNTNY